LRYVVAVNALADERNTGTTALSESTFILFTLSVLFSRHIFIR